METSKTLEWKIKLENPTPKILEVIKTKLFPREGEIKLWYLLDGIPTEYRGALEAEAAVVVYAKPYYYFYFNLEIAWSSSSRIDNIYISAYPETTRYKDISQFLTNKDENRRKIAKHVIQNPPDLVTQIEASYYTSSKELNKTLQNYLGKFYGSIVSSEKIYFKVDKPKYNCLKRIDFRFHAPLYAFTKKDIKKSLGTIKYFLQWMTENNKTIKKSKLSYLFEIQSNNPPFNESGRIFFRRDGRFRPEFDDYDDDEEKKSKEKELTYISSIDLIVFDANIFINDASFVYMNFNSEPFPYKKSKASQQKLLIQAQFYALLQEEISKIQKRKPRIKRTLALRWNFESSSPYVIPSLSLSHPKEYRGLHNPGHWGFPLSGLNEDKMRELIKEILGVG